jgi:ABC-type Fe3+ transport system permease subunit
MRWPGVVGRIPGACLLFGLLFLGLAAWPSAFLDRGATGAVRVSVFPLALTLFDPFIWSCARNSLLIAGMVSVGSLVIGVVLGFVAATSRFRGRSLLWVLAIIPAAAGPLLLAPGVALALGGTRASEWLSARSFWTYSFDELVRWMALVWIGLATGAPIVALVVTSSLKAMESAWIEAARASEASRIPIVREILWPILRPEVARASAAVFTLSLVEPAGPLILGLNRTLAHAILDSAIRLDQPTRAASLAILAILIAAIGRTLIGWWGGPLIVRSDFTASPIVERAGFRRGWICRLILAGWVTFAVGPLGLLVFKAVQVLEAAGSGLWKDVLEDPELHHWIANSATTASLALLVDLVILRTLLGRRMGLSDHGLKMTSRFLKAIPPLALGVGAYATPWLLEALGDTLGGVSGVWIRSLALELNPARSPGYLLILVVAAGKLPMLVKIAEMARSKVRTSLVDASKLMGVPDAQANLAGQGNWLGFVPGRAAILVLALASLNLPPALLMSPFSERRTVAPAILLSILHEGLTDPRIALAIVGVLVWKLGAFALASSCRAGSLGEWYRG